ncbi:hypothetical protein GALMADRAFT_255750 [Galerina marginata CBS 339.88]|uniref:Uncharacterized protein n=1 Tax=Galerina marginata (strain CBS 339.88) TaxID=685588 RepID=A0A067SSX1_GALM3|nr:hypothetical protein GALMADRAFT_255750 [Galerina marginata CBS 339.88]
MGNGGEEREGETLERETHLTPTSLHHHLSTPRPYTPKQSCRCRCSYSNTNGGSLAHHLSSRSWPMPLPVSACVAYVVTYPPGSAPLDPARRLPAVRGIAAPTRWFREGCCFVTSIPRSRLLLLCADDDERKRIAGLAVTRYCGP